MVGNKAAVGMGDAISVVPNPADFGGKRDHAAKFPGYVVYVAYRQPLLSLKPFEKLIHVFSCLVG